LWAIYLEVTRRGGAARRGHFGTISRQVVQSVEEMASKGTALSVDL